MAMTNNIVTWAMWMELNGINAFRSLTPDDLEAFTEKAVFGQSYLLQFPARLEKHISKLKQSGYSLPRRRARTLDCRRVVEEANIDWSRARHDLACTYQLMKLAQDQGLYLYPRQRQILLKPPPRVSRINLVSVYRQLQPWECQWQIRRLLPGDKLTFDPFPSVTLAKTAERLGVASGRTKTVPVDQAMFLLDRSIRWVLNYSEAILEMAREVDAISTKNTRASRRRNRALREMVDNLKMPQGPGQPWPIQPTLISTSSYHWGLSATLRCLLASCFVIIAAFTARRRREITSYRAKGIDNEFCITSDESGYWIELWIEKTIRDWDRTPCPEIVVKAVDVLLRLSESARQLSGTTDLFQYKLWGRSKAATFRVVKALAELTERVEVPTMPDGTRWTFQAHQFRRFFAIMYIWRYELGDLSALSYQLRHYNLEMTLRYVTEPTQGKIFREVQTEHAVSILREVALGRRDAGGPFAERFKKVAQRIRAQMTGTVQILTEEKFAEQIERLVVRSGKVLKGFPWGYCSCGPSKRDLSQARCIQSDNNDDNSVHRGPDESKATLKTCASCEHHLTHKSFLPYVSNQIELHEKAAADKRNGRLIRNASASYVLELKKYCQRAFGIQTACSKPKT
jgi:hypothetical protein